MSHAAASYMLNWEIVNIMLEYIFISDQTLTNLYTPDSSKIEVTPRTETNPGRDIYRGK